MKQNVTSEWASRVAYYATVMRMNACVFAPQFSARPIMTSCDGRMLLMVGLQYIIPPGSNDNDNRR